MTCLYLCRFGEPVRFRFLVGMLSGACPDLLAAGLQFINTFVETAPGEQQRFYIQAELDQAGFKPAVLAKVSCDKRGEGKRTSGNINTLVLVISKFLKILSYLFYFNNNIYWV